MTSTHVIKLRSRWITSRFGSVPVLLMITTRCSRAAVDSLLFVIASPDSSTRSEFMPQSKKAMALRAGHKTGPLVNAKVAQRGKRFCRTQGVIGCERSGRLSDLLELQGGKSKHRGGEKSGKTACHCFGRWVSRKAKSANPGHEEVTHQGTHCSPRYPVSRSLQLGGLPLHALGIKGRAFPMRPLLTSSSRGWKRCS